MSTVIAPPYTERIEHYCLGFEWKDTPGAGFSFECDKNGNIVNLTTKGDLALDNLLLCFTDDRISYEGIQDFSRDYRHGATVKCNCGETVYCDDRNYNSCTKCPREYNFMGQQLAPRSQWGSEFNRQPEEDIGLYSAENCR